MRVALESSLEDLTEGVIGAAFEVSNILGHGFLEVVYQRAMAVELEKRGIVFERKVSFEVSYKQRDVGVFVADFVIDKKVIVELKAIERLSPAHVGQVLNYWLNSRFVGIVVESLSIRFGSQRDGSRALSGLVLACR